MKYRVAGVFIGVWLLAALVSLVLGPPPYGPGPWELASYFTVGGRIAREIYGPVEGNLPLSGQWFVLSLIEVALVGLGIGLVLDGYAGQRPVQRTLGVSVLLVYLVATSSWRRSARPGQPSRTGCDPRGSRYTSPPSLVSAEPRTPRTSTCSSD